MMIGVYSLFSKLVVISNISCQSLLVMADNMPSQEEDALKAHSQARSSSDDEGSNEH